MHPIVSRPDRAWIAYAAIGGVGGLIAVLPLRKAGADAVEAGWFAGWGVLMMFVALQSWHIARYVPIAKVPFKQFAFTAAAAALVSSGLWLLSGWGLAVLLQSWLPSVEPAFRAGWPALWVGGATSFLCLLLLNYALDAADEGEASARRALESEVSSREAELRALRAQVDPHFLFNCLHSISSMTSRNPEGARRMCLELAEFFRASLKAGAEQRIPLSTELALLRGYLGIEQVRFGDRLRIHVDDAGDRGDVMVPALLLQPLVENAVRHGIATLVEGGEVAVRVTPGPDRVDIIVENPFDPDGRRPGTGVGLANVRDRLATAFRGGAKIRVETVEGETPMFRVSVSIPADGKAGAERSGGQA